jgi:hypothetical protein
MIDSTALCQLVRVTRIPSNSTTRAHRRLLQSDTFVRSFIHSLTQSQRTTLDEATGKQASKATRTPTQTRPHPVAKQCKPNYLGRQVGGSAEQAIDDGTHILQALQ